MSDSNFKIIPKFWFFVGGGILFLVLFFTGVGYGLFGDMPEVEDLENPKNALSSEIYGEDGVIIGKAIYDHSLKKNNFFFKKHLQYAKREAVHQIFFIENNATTTRSHLKFYFYKYFQLYFIRVVILFFFKNILLLGILDGLKGIDYSFKRYLVYRLMVDFFICKFKLLNLKKLVFTN